MNLSVSMTLEKTRKLKAADSPRIVAFDAVRFDDSRMDEITGRGLG